MTKKQARKEALLHVSEAVKRLAEERPASIFGGLDPADTRRLRDELLHIAKRHRWDADGRPEQPL